jgi:Domain of unknown function (DUF4274)
MSLTTWLKDKDPDVWFVITDYLNWDNSHRVLKWIVKQPQCDKANAAKIFWLADPAFFAREIATGGNGRSWSESWPLVETILTNWRSGFYQRSELVWPDEGGRASISHYLRSVAGTAGADRAIDIPRDLFGPLPGRQPRVPADLMPQENAELWDMLKRQGTFAGSRPGSDEWTAEREKAAAARNPPRLVTRLFGRKPL